MEIEFTTQVFKEGRTYVAYTPELDVSSCGRTEDKARLNLIEAVRLFLEEAGNMGTIDQILEEAGYVRRRGSLRGAEADQRGESQDTIAAGACQDFSPGL